MATPDVFSGEELLIQIGDGASPEAFTHRCMINGQRSLSRSASTTQEVVPDCDDPSAPGWVQTEIDSLTATIQGEGMIDIASLEFFDLWYESGESKTIKAKINRPGARTYTGKYKLSQLDYTGQRKTKATASITMVSDGPVLSAANV